MRKTEEPTLATNLVQGDCARDSPSDKSGFPGTPRPHSVHAAVMKEGPALVQEQVLFRASTSEQWCKLQNACTHLTGEPTLLLSHYNLYRFLSQFFKGPNMICFTKIDAQEKENPSHSPRLFSLALSSGAAEARSGRAPTCSLAGGGAPAHSSQKPVPQA